jgi:hypothetical protein
MIENNSEELNKLSDRLEKMNRTDAILAEVAEALDLKWIGEKPKSIRKKIAKDISPDLIHDTHVKKSRTKVLAHVNRAMDIAKADGTANKPMEAIQQVSAKKNDETVEDIIKQYSSAKPRRRNSFSTRRTQGFSTPDDDPELNLTRGNKIFRLLDTLFAIFNGVMGEIENLWSYLVQNKPIAVMAVLTILTLLFLLR